MYVFKIQCIQHTHKNHNTIRSYEDETTTTTLWLSIAGIIYLDKHWVSMRSWSSSKVRVSCWRSSSICAVKSCICAWLCSICLSSLRHSLTFAACSAICIWRKEQTTYFEVITYRLKCCPNVDLIIFLHVQLIKWPYRCAQLDCNRGSGLSVNLDFNEHFSQWGKQKLCCWAYKLSLIHISEPTRR